MRVLVVDRDSLVCQLITSRLQALGHVVTVEPSKRAAVELYKENKFDVIFLDPTPMKSARKIIVEFWKVADGNNPYIFLLSQELTAEEAIADAAHDVMNKPIDKQELETKITNAERVIILRQLLTDGRPVEAPPGTINKEAFCQLFLSAIDRATRYGERSFVMFFCLENYEDLREGHGLLAAEETANELARFLVRLRRQSDVLGKMDEAEYCLMMQRPVYEAEPFEAANRFASELIKFEAEFEPRAQAPKIFLTMIELPFGAMHVQNHIPRLTAAETAEVL